MLKRFYLFGFNTKPCFCKISTFQSKSHDQKEKMQMHSISSEVMSNIWKYRKENEKQHENTKNFSCFVIIHDCHPWLHKYHYNCGQTYHLTKPDINSFSKKGGRKKGGKKEHFRENNVFTKCNSKSFFEIWNFGTSIIFWLN